MRAVDLIAQKRDGGELSTEAIQWFIQAYTEGELRVAESHPPPAGEEPETKQGQCDQRTRAQLDHRPRRSDKRSHGHKRHRKRKEREYIRPFVGDDRVLHVVDRDSDKKRNDRQRQKL